MRNPGRAILKAWFELLDGSVVVDGNTIPVRRTDIESDFEGHYILLRLESSSNRNTNSSFDTFPVVIVDTVTRFANKIDDVVAPEISSAIDSLVFIDPSHHGLPDQPGFKIVSVTKQNETVLPEDNGATPKINRLVSRYSHRVLQTDES